MTSLLGGCFHPYATHEWHLFANINYKYKCRIVPFTFNEFSFIKQEGLFISQGCSFHFPQIYLYIVENLVVVVTNGI
jgi:hypothetical protein